ncbi:MAG: SEL1-like repeat protein [Synergistaceae bacterium]|nr:SEL1-like repeat protein [Synergistaceae bacterium]MBR0034556.1 SEL1-like repeat protein [Synergistaceae bacterium]
MLRRTSLFFAVLMAAFYLSSAEASQIRLAVLNTTDDTNLSHLAEIIADNFTGVLARSNAVTLVERDKLAIIMNEQKIHSSQFQDSSIVVKLGKILGCQYILLSSLKYEASPVISARIVEVSTSQIVFSDTEIPDTSDNSSIMAASSRLADKVLEVMAGEQAVITEIRGKEIVINRGSAARVRTGDLFRVFIGSKRKVTDLAVIRVKDVRQNFSTTEIVRNGGNINVLRRSDTVSAVSKKEADSLIKRKKFAKKRPGETNPIMSAEDKLHSSLSKEDKYLAALQKSYDEIAEKSSIAIRKNEARMIQEAADSFVKLGHDVSSYRRTSGTDEQYHELMTMQASISESTQEKLDERSRVLNDFSNKCFESAVSLLRPLASQGNVEAQVYIGMIYINRLIIPSFENDDYSKHEHEAFEFLNQAAEHGDTEALYYLAHAYDWGIGAALDEAKAAKLYQQVIDRGRPSGNMRFDYSEFPKNVYSEACAALSGMYLQGRGVAQDDRKAHELFIRASAHTNEEEQQFLTQDAQSGETEGDFIFVSGSGNSVSGGGRVVVRGEANLVESSGKVDIKGEGNVVISGNEDNVTTSGRNNVTATSNEILSPVLIFPVQLDQEYIKLGAAGFESSSGLMKEAHSINETFIKSLSASGALIVLNIQKRDSIGRKSNADDLDAVSNLGRKEGCKYMLIGSVKRDKDIILTVRAVDVETTKVIFSVSAASHSPKLSSLLAESAKLGEQVRERFTGEYPVVSSVNGKEIYINRGSSSGIRKGDLFRVYEEMNDVIDKDGNFAGKSTIDLAVAEIKSVKANESVAALFKNGGDAKVLPRLQYKRVEAISVEEAKDLIRRKTFALRTIEQKNANIDELNKYLALDFKYAIKPASDKDLEVMVRLAEAGNPFAQYALGNYYIALKKFPLAIKWLEASKTRSAHRDLGCMYLYGLGVPQNYQKAFELMTKAAGEWDSIANIYLGFMYENGYGVDKDLIKADSLYQKFIDINANSELHDELGVLNNFAYRKAIAHFQNFADKNNDVMLKVNLGILYCMLIDVFDLQQLRENSESHDFLNKAREWFQKALIQCQRERNIDSELEKSVENVLVLLSKVAII